MKEKVAAISILANVVLAGGKITVGVLSNSAAILAEGLHSFMDIFSSAVGYIGIRISKKPEDQKHPYGHYKFEVLAGTIITLILLVTGGAIVYEAYQNFLNPEKIIIGYLAFGVMIFSAVINEIMARVKIHFGKKESSISLLSDGVHSRVDVYASLAILVGLFFTKYWIYTDSLLALLVGLYIIKESFSLGKKAIDSLLDVSAGEEIEEKIKSIAKTQNIEICSLKTQKKGSTVTANLEIKLPNNLNVEEATKISGSLRESLMDKIEPLQYVAIQITSHEVETGFYKPDFGRGFGWQRRGKFKGEIKEATGRGPSGYCVCPECGYKKLHERGIPCSSLKCPKCDIDLKRE
ncbi:cation diffusion facilitator family transporter [Patescibacteria group bacterium]|nr:cation diffusion facilitator family transporter [Patescibacteria group bacterium]